MTVGRRWWRWVLLRGERRDPREDEKGGEFHGSSIWFKVPRYQTAGMLSAYVLRVDFCKGLVKLDAIRGAAAYYQRR
jgi:hypothetical protein